MGLLLAILMPRHLCGVIKWWCCLTSKSRIDRPRKTKIGNGTEIAQVTRDLDTTFKIKRSKVNLLLMP